MLSRILLSPDAGDGTPPVEPKELKPVEPKPAPPAAAKTVANGKSEKEVELETELEAKKKLLETEEKKRIKLETDVSHLQDENKSLREVGLKPPINTPSVKKSNWLDEWAG